MKIQNPFNFKSTLISIIVCSTLTTTGCFEKNEDNQTEVNTHKQVSSDLSMNKTNDDDEVNLEDLDNLLTDLSSEQEEDPKSPLEDSLAMFVSKRLAINFNYKVNNSQWNQNQVDCFGVLNGDFIVQEAENLLKKNLSSDEYETANKFYHSSTGEISEQWITENLNNSIEERTPSIDDLNLSEQEKVIYNNFIGSPIHIKVDELINGQQMESIVINKTKTKLLDCHML